MADPAPWLEPLVLEGRLIRLLPLLPTHAPGLFEVGCDQDIWRFMPYGLTDSLAAMQAWVTLLLERQARGTDLPFVICHRARRRLVGATRYVNADPPNRTIEIGGTWYGAAYRGTAVNPEAKLLLLEQAFGRLGAMREGVWREHMILPDGYRRSSVFYSLLQNEWPAVRAGLRQRVAGDEAQAST